METQYFNPTAKVFVPWNKGRVTGQKPPLKPREVWAIRVRLQISDRVRDLALFNLAIDSKLRGCDLTHLRVEDVIQGDQVRTRALVSQRKTGAPVQFEITEQARAAVARWVNGKALKSSEWLFPSRVDRTKPMTTRQYGRLVDEWIADIGLSPAAYGTHSLRRTKAALIYRKTGNIRAVQLLLGHTKLDSTVRYLGVDVIIKAIRTNRAIVHRTHAEPIAFRAALSPRGT